LKEILINGVNVAIEKKSGRTTRKDKRDGKFKPVKFNLSHNGASIGLKGFMTIKDIDIKQAVKELEACNSLLVGEKFEIIFFEEADVKKFIEIV
jgi:hypothetical protein